MDSDLQSSGATLPDVGVVVIGRNEGDRLVRCLQSVSCRGLTVVYVDSYSTDGSAERASQLGAVVVRLDMSRPFTAARARNVGLSELVRHRPGTEYIQFLDGDCEMISGWTTTAKAFMETHSDVAVASGRLRERDPEASIYNLLCDMEWDAPAGEAKACGGIALMRVAALRQTGGFRDGLVAGEEPELCVRIRAAGWKVWRLNVEMALHDAAMMHFSQWWRRTIRSGHAYAEGASLHGGPPERHWVRETRRAWAWGVALPVFTVLTTAAVGPVGLLPALAYPLQMVRLGLREQRPWRARWARAFFLVLGRVPEGLGVLKFHLRRLQGGPATLIEYK